MNYWFYFGMSVFTFHSLLLSRSHWSFQKRHFQDLFDKLLFLDSIALSASIEILIADENTCEELVETKGPGAQSLVNLLHAVCLQVVCTPCYIDTSNNHSAWTFL